MKQLLSLLLVFLIAFACFGCAAQEPSSSASSDESPAASPSESAPAAEVTESAAPDASSAAEESAESSQGAPGNLETVYPVTVTDMEGVESTIEAADRIVSMTTSSTQILIAEGALDRIVGVDAYSASLAPDVEVVGDYSTPDIEKIVSLEPDVVIAANSIQQDAIDQMRSLGIPVVAAEPTTWEQVPEGFELIGRIINAQAQARELSEQLAEVVDEAQQNAPAEAPTSYYVLSYGDAGNWTSGEGSFINAMMEIAGAAPVTQDTAAPWLEYPLEDLVQADPECIILGSAAGDLDAFAGTPGYADLTAVRDGHVYVIDSDLVTIPGPHLREGLLQISGIINECASEDTAEAA